MKGLQRYRCKACGLNFTDTPPRGMPLRVKVTAVLLYLSGLSMNRTAKLLGVSTPSVMAWIEQFAEAFAQKPEPEGRAVVVELDEMWHFLKKKRNKLVWGCLCQALVIAAPPWLEARPCGLALVGCVTIGGELALRGAGHRAANLYAVDPPGAKP